LVLLKASFVPKAREEVEALTFLFSRRFYGEEGK
jgi:hypothetical protein